MAGDAGLAVLLLAAFALPSDLAAESDVAAGVAFSVALLACVPFRRRAPVAAFVAVSVLCLAQLALLEHIVAGDFVALIALYTVVAYARDARIGAVASSRKNSSVYRPGCTCARRRSLKRSRQAIHARPA